MIKELEENTYKIKVCNSSYIIKIREKVLFPNRTVEFGYLIINKKSIFSLWKALNIYWKYDKIANSFAEDQFLYADWNCSIWFKNKETAKRFLYFIDRKYNQTPQNVTEFIDVELWTNL